MKHHESRLQADLDHIRQLVDEVADDVREQIDEAVRALLAGDRERMYAVILGDYAVNRKTRAIDEACHSFVAVHIPAAGHLRFVSSVLRINIALERIGDYSGTISRVGVQLDHEVDEPNADAIRLLADQASRMLELAARAFLTNDHKLAKDTRKMGRRIDRAHDRAFDKLVHREENDVTLLDIIRLQTVFDKLERVSDQAKNICEETVFVASGKVRTPKSFTILFLDADDTLLAPLAEGLARRAFPDSGKYHSAGLHAAEAYDPSLSVLEDQLQLDLGGPLPVTLAPLQAYPAEYQVLVTLNLPPEQIPDIPFHTVLLNWTLEVPDTPETPKGPMVRDLNERIARLMERLHGPGAS